MCRFWGMSNNSASQGQSGSSFSVQGVAHFREPCLTIGTPFGDQHIGWPCSNTCCCSAIWFTRAITRGRKLVVLIGQRKALGMAVRNNRTENRFSGLLARLIGPG